MPDWSELKSGFMEHAWVWIRVGSIFVFTMLALGAVKRLAWRRVRRMAAGTQATWDDDLLDAAERPLRFGVLVLALSLSIQAAPAAWRAHPLVTVAPKLAFILFAVWLIDGLTRILIRRQRIYPALSANGSTLIRTLARFLVVSIGTLIALDTLGIAITPILASLGIGSIAVALALQDTLGNFFSGVYILVDQPIRLGDFVRFEDGIEGTVQKVGWRSTRVLLGSNNTVVIPNSKLSSSRVINFNLPDPETGFALDLGVGYESKLDHVERVIEKIALDVQRTVPGAVSEFKPVVRFLSFGDSSVNLTIGLRARTFGDSGLIKHELIKRLHEALPKEGISIPYPQRVVHTRPLS